MFHGSARGLIIVRCFVSFRRRHLVSFGCGGDGGDDDNNEDTNNVSDVNSDVPWESGMVYRPGVCRWWHYDSAGTCPFGSASNSLHCPN